MTTIGVRFWLAAPIDIYSGIARARLAVSLHRQLATFEQKRQRIELFVDRVVVTGEEVEIRSAIPTSFKSERYVFVICDETISMLQCPRTRSSKRRGLASAVVRSADQIDHFLACDPGLTDGDRSREFSDVLNERPVFQVSVHFSADTDLAIFNAAPVQIESRILNEGGIRISKIRKAL